MCKSDGTVRQTFYSTYTIRGGVTQWVVRLTRGRWIPASREFEPHQRPRCFLEQQLYSLCLVLVGSRNGFERDLHKQLLVSQSN